jgi:hypothetical protein
MTTTMKLIAKNVLGSSAASVTFSSIPATYDDLYLVVSGRTDRALVTDSAILEFNGASMTGSSTRYLFGDGASATSSSESNKVYGAQCTGANATASTFGNSECYIPNYTGSAKKSVSVTGVNENNATTAYIFAFASLWDNTAAITSIVLKPNVGPNFVSGSSFYLFGITKS